MAQVITTLAATGRVCYSKGLQGIGPKESAGNKRNFSEEQLAAGKNVISLQVKKKKKRGGIYFRKSNGIFKRKSIFLLQNSQNLEFKKRPISN